MGQGEEKKERVYLGLRGVTKGQWLEGPITDGERTLRNPRLVNLTLTLDVVIQLYPLKKEHGSWGMPEPPPKALGELVVIIPSQPRVQWHPVG